MGCGASADKGGADGEREDTGKLPDAHEAAKTLDRARWMTTFGDRIADQKLPFISMVGIHDAATFNINGERPIGISPEAPKLIGDICEKGGSLAYRVVSDWACCQSLPVASALEFGVRYLDIRLVARGSGSDMQLWVSHSLYSVPFAAVVDDMVAFYGGRYINDADGKLEAKYGDLARNKEIVVFDVQKVEGHDGPDGPAINAAFAKAIEPLRPLLAKEGQSVAASTVGELWSAGTRIVALYPNPGAAEEFGPGLTHRDGALRSDWKNKNTVADLVPELKGEIVNTRGLLTQAQPDMRLHVLQAVLTPDTEAIVNGLLLPDFIAPDSVFTFAGRVNDDAMELWVHGDAEGTDDKHLAPAADGRNILMLDYAEKGTYEGLDAVQITHFLNVRKFGVPQRDRDLPGLDGGVAADDTSPFLGVAGLKRFTNRPLFVELAGGTKLYAKTGAFSPVLALGAGSDAKYRVDTPVPARERWTLVPHTDGNSAVLRCATGALLRVAADSSDVTVQTEGDRTAEEVRFTIEAADAGDKPSDGGLKVHLKPVARQDHVLAAASDDDAESAVRVVPSSTDGVAPLVLTIAPPTAW